MKLPPVSPVDISKNSRRDSQPVDQDDRDHVVDCWAQLLETTEGNGGPALRPFPSDKQKALQKEGFFKFNM